VRKAAFDFAATFPSPDDVPNPAWPAGWQGHKRYAQAVAWLDRGVGTVLWALSHRGILHSTLLAFTSDQPSVDKGHCYTQGTRTPMMMQWPGRIPAGGGYYGLVSLADLVPTFLEAAGGEGELRAACGVGWGEELGFA
jgi:arylsulfatase A-like enzyme